MGDARWLGRAGQWRGSLACTRWRGLIGIVALIGALIGFWATPVLADDIRWIRPYQNTAFPFGTPQHIAADPTGLYVVGLWEPSQPETQTLEQKYSPAGNVVNERISTDPVASGGTGITASGDAVYEVIVGQKAGVSG